MFEHSKHVAMWEWIATQTDRMVKLHMGGMLIGRIVTDIKREYIDYINETKSIGAYCYACEAVHDHEARTYDCMECPLEIDVCYLSCSQYERFKQAIKEGNSEKASAIARQIAYAKVREGVECI